ncbi:MAG TPA: hypothetical protein VN669_12715 [Candidatus Acidoferrales bacterium]|nr:hypothetical protein [Candidatus Acidoferrales bacterium]
MKATTLFISSLLCMVCVAQTTTPVPVAPRPPATRALQANSNPATYVPNRTVTPTMPITSVRAAQTVQPARIQPQPNPVAPEPSVPLTAQAVPEPPKSASSGRFSVDYRNGEVTVIAEKAELGKVLELLGKKIGTSIEVAPEAANDPVVAHLGPVTPTQALAELLDGPTLEYIVMGSDDSGHVLQRVVVRRRNTFGREPLVAVKAAAAAASNRNPSNR